MGMGESRVVVHMIGNAHIDPVWLWRVAEGREEVLATYRSALDRMDETGDFVFTSGGAVTYRWVQEDAPALFAAIQQRVAEGRWALVNGWWIQPDCNIPAGESFARHGLYGQRALQEMFGCHARTGYNVDSFGHPASLPQLLRGCGLENYVFFRPAPGVEKDLPGSVFWWESDDGSRVLASRPPLHYPSGPGELIERIDRAAAEAHPEVGHVMCFYGVGNHGGGPTKENIASIQRAQSRPEGPEVRFSSPDQFFQAVRAGEAALPLLHDELQHHARGCYSAVSRIKWYNRKSEHALLDAEKLSALADRYCDVEYPREALTMAWENVLFNQFHDILAGTSLREACDDAYESYEESTDIAELAVETALAALADRTDTRGPGRPLLVWNTLSWARHVPVETTVPVSSSWHDDWRGAFLPGAVRLLDETGTEIPTQVTALEHSGGRYLIHFCFMADLPALGYRCYHLDLIPDAPRWDPPLPRPVETLENEFLRLRFDGQRGWLAGLLLKEEGVELLREAGGIGLVLDDPSDTWSHDVVSYDEELGRFEAAGEVMLVESGPVRQCMRVTSRWGRSTATLDYTLYAGDRQLYLTLTVDWHEQLKALKLAFPLRLEDAQATASIPYGRFVRPADGGEEPCQAWVDLAGTLDGRAFGLGLLNDSKYAYDARGSDLRLTVLRSPVFAFHQPRRIEPGVTYYYVDQGEQVVELALVPHAGTYVEGDVVRRAESLNTPPIVGEVGAHAGEWPGVASLVSVAPANVILTTLKRAEEGNGLILRGYETAGQRVTAEIQFGEPGNQVSWAVDWGPYQVKTLHLRPGASPVEVNMLEEAV